MVKTFSTVLLAALIWGGTAYADGRVLSAVSPSVEELKEPAKKNPVNKVVKKTAKKTKRKVAAPASHAEAPLQPVGGHAPRQPKTSGIKDAKQAAPLMVPEPKVELLSNQQAPNKIAQVEKPKSFGQVYVLFQSKPGNAEVVVDGYYAGSTPLELPIKEGNHSLRLIYPGYEEWERKFNAYKGMRVNALLVEKKQAPATP